MVQFIDGKRTARTATTRDNALQIAHRLHQRPTPAPSRTLAAALREYDAHLRLERRLSPASCAQTQRTLRAFLVEDERPISALTAAHAHKLARFEHAPSRRIRRRYARCTRHAVLGHAGRFFAWAKSLSYVEQNPFDGVRPVGLPAIGPPPISLDQARTLAAVALRQAHTDPGALGALLVLVLGLRSAEVRHVRVQDIDPEAQQIHIAGLTGITRTIVIPELLRPCLRGARADKPPEALLLGAGRTGHPRPHNFLWRALQRLCRQAHVSPTCPRSLRTLHRKLAQTARRTTSRLAETPNLPESLTCREHVRSADWVRVVDLLGLSPSLTAPRMDALLSVLTPSQFAQLHPALQSQVAGTTL